MRKDIKTPILISAVAAAVLVLGLSATIYRQNVTRNHDFTVAPRITEDSLSIAYQQDWKLAANRFTNRMIVLSGEVSGTDYGIVDGYIVDVGPNVQCIFKSDADRVSRGMHVMVYGKCHGIDRWGLITMSDCQFANRRR